MTALTTNTPRKLDRTDWIILGLILVYTIAGILTLPNYGLTWDEGLGNLFFGERYFLFFSHPQETAIDFKADLPPDHLLIDLALSPFRRMPHMFPPVADTISAAGMYLFSYRLGWMDPVDAFHLPKVLAVGVLLWAVYWFTRRRFGRFAGIIALLLLAAFPRLWGDMHFNPKDVPETVLFALTIIGYVAWLERPSWAGALGIGLLFGAALATKANAAFIPFILLLGLWPPGIDLHAWREQLRVWIRPALQHAVMAISAAGFFILSWPYLYIGNSLVRGMTTYIRFVLDQGGHSGTAGWKWNWGPLQQTVFSMPEVMLGLLIVGLIAAALNALRDDPRRTNRLMLAWCLLPVLRASMPGMVNFDGIRHFLEFAPAAAVLGGIGAERLLRFRWPSMSLRSCAAVAIVIAIIANAAFIARDFWGYEYIYYNSLVGGLRGAQAVFGENEATDYWASSYRRGMTWLDAHAEKGAAVYVPVVGYLAQITGPLWLRPDIQVYDDRQVTEFTRSGRPAYIMLLDRPQYWDDFTRQVVPKLRRVYEISVQGVPVLQIFER